MKQWYASVNYGLEPIIGDILKNKKAKNVKILDGAITFSCVDAINTRCINNLYIILSLFYSDSILDAAKRISRTTVHSSCLNGMTFRIIIMDCGKLKSIPNNMMSEIEKNVSRQTGHSVNRANPDTEIWLNRRNDSMTYFMVRVKKHSAFDKVLKQGELRPDIAAVMLYMAKINKQSIVVDPFGGWGAIAAAVIENGQYKRIYTGDINDQCVQYQKARFRKNNDCTITKWDALSLPLEDMSVDSIITDPPWGEYKHINTESFYDGFISEAARILRTHGSFVFLSSAQRCVCQLLVKHHLPFIDIPLKINGRDTCLFSAKHKKKEEKV